MAWNEKSGPVYPDRDDKRDSFRRHDERMKSFRLSHARIETRDSKVVRTVQLSNLLPIATVKLAVCAYN